MAQDENYDDKDNDRGKRSIFLISTIALACFAAGGGYWIATQPTPAVAPAVVEPAKPAETAKTEATTETKPTTAPAAEAAKPAVEAAPAVAVVEPATPVEQPAVTAPKPAVESPDVQQTAAPQPVAEPAPAEVATKTEPAAAPAETAKVESPAENNQQVAVASPQAAAAAETGSESQVEAKPKEPEAAAPAAAAPAAVEKTVPKFDTVRVESNGDAVIAGRAEPDSEVTIKHSGAVIGTAKTDATGAFAFVTEKPLPTGAGALSLETLQNGQMVVSDQTIAVAVKGEKKGEPMVALVEPDKPAQVVQAPTSAKTDAATESVKLDAVDYDGAGNIIFSGRGRPGMTIRIYVDNAATGEVKADPDGKWMFAGTNAIAAGTHMLRVDEIGADGKVSSRVELPFLREEAAKVVASAEPADAPAAPAPAAATPEPAAAEPVAAVQTQPAETQQAAVAPTAAPEPTRMIIQPGNNLWRLSRQVYGKGIQYTVIYEANKDQIRDPDLIYPGQVFVMPPAAP